MKLKLVRDKVQDFLEAKEGQVRYAHTVSPGLLRNLLILKLHEEAQEIQRSSSSAHVLEEIADCVEVLREIARTSELTWDAVEAARVAKREKLGGFERGFILEVD